MLIYDTMNLSIDGHVGVDIVVEYIRCLRQINVHGWSGRVSDNPGDVLHLKSFSKETTRPSSINSLVLSIHRTSQALKQAYFWSIDIIVCI